jgi:UDPglucose 6-dehydrogenase
MKVAVLGLWHLGTVTAACTAAAGVATIAIDDDSERIAGLARGKPPLFEPGLAELIRAGLDAKTLVFTDNHSAVADCDVVWVCHDTQVDEEDRANVAYVTNRVEGVFDYLKDGAVVLVSSQLPVGSIRALEHAYAARTSTRDVAFASSPENLRLGQAVQIFQNPGRVIVGVRDPRTREVLEPLLLRFCDTLIWMSVESAEMVKHTLNAFLAVSITFTNEVATICESVGADASEVEVGLRSDPRIGQRAFVKAGAAFAGGTLARDVIFLDNLAHKHRVKIPLINSVLPSNRAHGKWALNVLRRELNALTGKTVGVLGLVYKPGTDTLRRSTAVELIRAIVNEGATVRAFDPKVSALPADLAGSVALAPDVVSAARGAHALVLATEWPEFRNISAEEMAKVMAGNVILDPARYLANSFGSNSQLKYISVGRVP